MIDKRFTLATAEELRDRIPVGAGPLSTGQARKLADDVQTLLITLKPAFREAGLINRITAAENIAKELTRSRADTADILSRLFSAATSIHMDAIRLADRSQA